MANKFITHGSATFNSTGADQDFRVASDGNDNMLFVDAQYNHVNIGTSTDHGGLLNLNASDGSFIVMNGTSNNKGFINWESNGFTFYTNGPQEALRIGSSETVVNEDGRAYDFRIESDDKEYAFFADASENKFGFNLTSGDVGDSNTSFLFRMARAAGKAAFVHDSGDGGIIVAGTGSASQGAIMFGNNWTQDDGTGYTEEYRIYMDGADDSLNFAFGGVSTYRALKLGSGGDVTFNTSNASADLLVKTVNQNTTFFVDGDTDLVGISTTSPSATLDVAGGIRHKTLTPATHGTSGGANSYWYEIYRVDFQTSSFNTNQHYIRIIGAGGTSGQHGSGILEVSFKQQSGSKYFNIFPLEMSGIEMGYVWDATGGDNSAGRLSIYARSIGGNYMYIQPFQTARDANPEEDNVRGVFPMASTGSQTDPTGIVKIYAPLYIQGQRYTTAGNVSNTFFVNRDGNDINFRVSGTTEDYLIHADAGLNAVGIGTQADTGGSNMLDVGGYIRQNGVSVAGVVYRNSVTKTRNVGSGNEWFKVWENTVSPSPQLIKLRVTASGDNTSWSGEFFVTIAGYNFSHSINLIDYQYYNQPKLKEIKTVNPGSAATNEIWVRVDSITTSVGTLTVQSDSGNLVSSLVAASEPSATIGTAHMYNASWPADSTRTSMAFSNAVAFSGNDAKARFWRDSATRSSQIFHDNGGMVIETNDAGDNLTMSVEGGNFDVNIPTNYEMNINHGSTNGDFVVQSNGNATMLMVDGDADNVKIGQSTGSTLGGLIQTKLYVNGAVNSGGLRTRGFANPNGRVITFPTGSNGNAMFIKLTCTDHQGIRETIYRCWNASGNWNVAGANTVTSGTAPTFTVSGSGTANPTITVSCNTSYSGGFLIIEQMGSIPTVS